MNKSNRITELDALRGIAAFSVVLFHLTWGNDFGLGNLSDKNFYFRYGFLGVQLFFIISGFVIYMTLDKIKHPLDFIVSRFSRLYPAYWAAIFFSVTITYFWGEPNTAKLQSVFQLLVNLTMFQHWVHVTDVEGLFWTLSVELSFYVIMFLILITNNKKFIVPITAIWLCLALIWDFGNHNYTKYIDALLMLRWCPLFIAGIYFYRIKFKIDDEKINIFMIIFSFIVEYLNIHNLNVIGKQNDDPIVYIIILLIFIIFFLFVYNKLSFITIPILLFLGSISYSLYLIHGNIGNALIYQLKKINNNQYFYLPITIITVVLLAYSINVLIERPFMVWIRSKYKKK
jgi:peptidoglycan/LPS O-acetylase OafA/YrhL